MNEFVNIQELDSPFTLGGIKISTIAIFFAVVVVIMFVGDTIFGLGFNFVSKKVKLLYYFASILLTIIFMLPSIFNPKKTLLTSILFYLKNNNKKIVPVNPKKEIEEFLLSESEEGERI